MRASIACWCAPARPSSRTPSSSSCRIPKSSARPTPRTLEVAAARAEFAAARLELESQRLDRRSSLAEAQRERRVRAPAGGRGGARIPAARGVGAAVFPLEDRRAGQLGERAKIEEQRLAALDAAVGAQLAGAPGAPAAARARAEESRLAADSLSVKAGIAGVVQSVPVQEGQQLAPGVNVARVAKPGTLYAELRIPELDARDLAPGLRPPSTCATASCAAASCAWTPP